MQKDTKPMIRYSDPIWFCMESRGSAVGKATGYGLDDRGIEQSQ
jgi:hypothetical protein